MSFYSIHKTFSIFFFTLFITNVLSPHLADKHHRVEKGFFSFTHAPINDILLYWKSEMEKDNFFLKPVYIYI